MPQRSAYNAHLVVLVHTLSVSTVFHVVLHVSFLSQALQTLLEMLVQGYGCEFSQRDIQRMELIVMQKLDFKLTNYTPHDFLKMVGSQSVHTHTHTQLPVWCIYVLCACLRL